MLLLLSLLNAGANGLRKTGFLIYSANERPLQSLFYLLLFLCCYLFPRN